MTYIAETLDRLSPFSYCAPFLLAVIIIITIIILLLTLKKDMFKVMAILDKSENFKPQVAFSSADELEKRGQFLSKIQKSKIDKLEKEQLERNILPRGKPRGRPRGIKSKRD